MKCELLYIEEIDSLTLTVLLLIPFRSVKVDTVDSFGIIMETVTSKDVSEFGGKLE